MRPTGIELVSSAPQADTLSIELWARKWFRKNSPLACILPSVWENKLSFPYYVFILTFLFFLFNSFVRRGKITVFQGVSYAKLKFDGDGLFQFCF